MSVLNYDCMKLDNNQLRIFKEFLGYKLNKGEKVSFNDLNRHIGLSKTQFEQFRLENLNNLEDKITVF